MKFKKVGCVMQYT